jgi:putative ATP-dependent endonuclease of OLD family
MRLRRLEISHFRGVHQLDWRHVGETAALVGPGDSGKSTILDAIERVLSPRWNLAFDDTDFWNLNTDEPIVIRATVTDLPAGFYRDTKFGLVMHGFDAEEGIAVVASGDEDEDHALVLELRVEDSLEPVWSVLDSEGNARTMLAKDRESLGMLRVGGFVDHHLGWSRGSVLTRLTETGDAVGAVLAEATRHARDGLNTDGLDKLQSAAEKVEAIGKNIGVATREKLTPHLDASSLSVSAGALSLHDGAVPVRRAGLGTRRLLAVAMQREAAARTGLTLVDEFENGLEPHRIRRLLRVLRGKRPESEEGAGGQLVLTTHSPTVLSELEAAEVSIARREASGVMVVECLPKAVAYVLKRTPEALLARKVVVVEGITEQGFCNALDESWTETTGASFGYRGVVVVDGGGGTQPAEVAGHLYALGYQVALLIDSDATAKASRARGAQVLAWSGGVATEERLALDLPLPAIREMTREATSRAKKGFNSVRDALAGKLEKPKAIFGEEPEAWVDAVSEEEFRSAFGAQAKARGWFKSREGGAFLGGLVCSHWTAVKMTPTMTVINGLWAFANNA